MSHSCAHAHTHTCFVYPRKRDRDWHTHTRTHTHTHAHLQPLHLKHSACMLAPMTVMPPPWMGLEHTEQPTPAGGGWTHASHVGLPFSMAYLEWSPQAIRPRATEHSPLEIHIPRGSHHTCPSAPCRRSRTWAGQPLARSSPRGTPGQSTPCDIWPRQPPPNSSCPAHTWRTSGPRRRGRRRTARRTAARIVIRRRERTVTQDRGEGAAKPARLLPAWGKTGHPPGRSGMPCTRSTRGGTSCPAPARRSLPASRIRRTLKPCQLQNFAPPSTGHEHWQAKRNPHPFGRDSQKSTTPLPLPLWYSFLVSHEQWPR